jgi:hypothetical protein
VARKSRFFLKKRGNRRTGSADAARVGEAALYFAMLAVGAAGLWAVLSWWIVPHWQADYDFVETVGTIVDSRVEEMQVTTLDKPLTPQRRALLSLAPGIGCYHVTNGLHGLGCLQLTRWS